MGAAGEFDGTFDTTSDGELDSEFGAVFEEVPAAVLAAATQTLADEPETDRVLVLDRVRRHWPDLLRGLELAYGERAPQVAADAVAVAVARFAERSPELRLLDLRRLAAPDWFQHPRMLGYACYAERFGGDLAGVTGHVDYLAELGVTYLHLMPLLDPRPAPNDGGYAVRDYRTVRPDLGTMADLAELARVLREHDISLTLDLVLNHVAREHDWAVRARAGEEPYRDYFHVYADRERPDAYEASLPEVFPDLAPGNFTWDDDLDAWVWTTFNSWQWDLNWHNPAVFGEFADLMLFLANQGVECLRLDAIAFLWKREGTDCQNQPEVHALTQALHAVTRIGAPAMVFKAEAIVAPADLPGYLGVGEHAGKVSDMAYHNGLMVHIWSSLAAGDARLARVALKRLPPVPRSTAWVTYVRCHDDIGWAIDDGDAAAVGWDGAAHRRFLSDWYSGTFPLSDSRGLVFGENPATGDRRISGTSASLAGLEAALDAGDEGWAGTAMRRHLLAHLMVMGFGGVPVLYMGDELALRNDYGYRIDPARADDNRWVHRPAMPWEYAERRKLAGSLENLAWQTIRHSIAVRSRLIAMHGSVPAEILEGSNPAVLAWARRHPRQTVVVLNNCSAQVQRWPLAAVPVGGALVDALTGKPARVHGYDVELEPYEAVWLLRGS